MVIHPIQNRKLMFTFSYDDFLIGCLVCWPMFWNIWNYLKVTASLGGSWVPLAILWILAIVTTVSHRIQRKSYLYLWLVFFAAMMVSIDIANIPEVIRDWSLYFSLMFFAVSMNRSTWDVNTMLKWIIRLGIFAVATILLDNIFGLFSNTLSGIFTDSALVVRSKSRYGAGIFSSLGIAEGYVISGLVAYIIRLRMQAQKVKAPQIILISLFIVCFIIGNKRGLAVALATTVFLIWLFGRTRNNLKSFNYRRFLQVLGLIVVLFAVLYILYLTVGPVRTALNSYIDRFQNDDTTLSGRTLLYRLATSLFSSHPVRGIGWGRYRTRTLGIFSSVNNTTYDAHNVYLQVLCETGIIGAVAFLAVIATAIIIAFSTYRRVIKTDRNDLKFLCQLGLFFQLYFLVYCMSGNPLYDYSYVVMYFMGLMLINRTKLELFKQV